MKKSNMFYFFTIFICSLILNVNLIYGKNYNTILLENKIEYSSDINFRILSQFYGLKTKVVNLYSKQLNDSLFKNEDGSYIKSICISYRNLEDTSLIGCSELNVIKSIIMEGSNLIINDISDSLIPNNTRILTDSVFIGASLYNNNDAWTFNSDADNICNVFSNTTVSTDTLFDKAFVINCIDCTNLITDRYGNNPIFSYHNIGSGKIFFNGNIISRDLNHNNMYILYYGWSYKYKLINNTLPIMMFIRYSNADMCWHNYHKYANLTIDDPYFIESYGYLNFKDLFNEMELHNFATTIAFIPRNFNKTFDTSVVDLFKEYPDRYSIVQHGNNHDGYEFICYTQQQLDSLNEMYNNAWLNQKPRPYKDQECDIVEGRTRLDYMQAKTGINYGKEMVFPYGISLSPTLEMLKKYNFNTTVNGQQHPYLLLPGDVDTNYDFNMKPSNMKFANFAVVVRHQPYFNVNPQYPNYLIFKLDLFLSKPILSYTHHELFEYGQNAYDKFADSINSWYPDVEWHSLDYIMKRLYLEKLNFDSTVDVLFFDNDIIVNNETGMDKEYHLKKYETGNVPIRSVKVDKHVVEYRLLNDTLETDIVIPAHCQRQIVIHYYSGDKDFLIDTNYIKREIINDTLYFDFVISNMGADSGACPVCIYYTKGDLDSLLSLSAIYLNSYGSKLVHLPLDKSMDIKDGRIEIKLDPYNLIDEKNENNNDYIYSAMSNGTNNNAKELIIKRNSVFQINSPLSAFGKFEIFDITGRKIFEDARLFNNGSNIIKWDCCKHHKGIYFAKIKIDTLQKILKFSEY